MKVTREHYPFLTEAERVVLAVLDGDVMRGLDIVRNSGGLLKRGTIYIVLSKMEEQPYIPYDRNRTITSEDSSPLVRSWEDADDPSFPPLGIRRRMYQGTRAGYYFLQRYYEYKLLLSPSP